MTVCMYSIQVMCRTFPVHYSQPLSHVNCTQLSTTAQCSNLSVVNSQACRDMYYVYMYTCSIEVAGFLSPYNYTALTALIFAWSVGVDCKDFGQGCNRLM